MSDSTHNFAGENPEHEAFDAEFVGSNTSARISDSPGSRESNLVRAWRQLRPGDVVASKYRVERSIGQSGLASIAQVRHLVLDQQALLKYLRPEARAFPETIANFLRGALLLAQMRNEHVAPVVDVGMLELGTPYIVLEQPDGPDLAQVLRVRGPLPIPEAVSYVIQACEGIAPAHALGVTHGNLSPFNLIVVKRTDGTPIIRVADFGSADVFDLSDVLGVDMGSLPSRALLESLRYLSPEHARTPDDVDARADVWALGAILHELLVGEPVYREKTVPGLLAMIAADQPKSVRALRPEVPGDLASAILRCLEKDRAARFTNASQLANALKACSTAATVTATSPATTTFTAVAANTPEPAKVQPRSTRPPPLPSIPPPPYSRAPSVSVPATGYSLPQFEPAPRRLGWIAAVVAASLFVGVLGADVTLRLNASNTPIQPAVATAPAAPVLAAATPAVVAATQEELSVHQAPTDAVAEHVGVQPALVQPTPVSARSPVAPAAVVSKRKPKHTAAAGATEPAPEATDLTPAKPAERPADTALATATKTPPGAGNSKDSSDPFGSF